MDVFEDQLNIALETIPETIPESPCSGTAVLSPTLSPVALKSGTSRSRPATRDSEMSTLSRLSTIKPPSVMGSMRSGMLPLHGGSTSILSGEGFDNRAFERSDYVSHRIAAIQAKVSFDNDIACATLTSSARDRTSIVHCSVRQRADRTGDCER